MNEKELTAETALQYLTELIAEYMKTFPPVIRGPVMQMSNACLAKVNAAIKKQAGTESKKS